MMSLLKCRAAGRSGVRVLVKSLAEKNEKETKEKNTNQEANELDWRRAKKPEVPIG